MICTSVSLRAGVYPGWATVTNPLLFCDYGRRTCCAPMERVKMQMMLHERTNTAFGVAGGIYRAEGVLGFWRGNGALLSTHLQEHLSS